MALTGVAPIVNAALAKRAGRAGLVIGARSRGETVVVHRGRLPDGPGSIFEIGSITKTFTATVLADMVADGSVALGDPAQRYLPDGVVLPVRGREITLEDLATHRSGLPRLPKGIMWPALTRERRDPYAALDEARLLAAIGVTRPRRAPGRKVAYSNYAVGLLGYLLARRLDMSYEQLVRSRVCEPLGLVDTWVDTPAPELRRVAIGHTRRGRQTPHWRLAALAGAGGLRSTAADILSFLSLHMSTSASPLAAAAADTARSRTPGRNPVGLGWMIFEPGRKPGPRFLLHDGGTGGFRSFAAVVPELDLAAVVLNSQARSVSRLGFVMLQDLIEEAQSA